MPTPHPTYQSLQYLTQIVPNDLKTAHNWLIWKYVTREGDKKPRKIPYYAKTLKPRTAHGSDEDRKSLVTLDEALRACKRGGFSGVGLAPLDDLPYCAVDFDNCLQDGKLIKDQLKSVIDATYAEVSPSGNGIRLLFAGKLGISASIKNLASGVELFDGTGFVTVTGNRFNTKPIKPIAEPIRVRLRGWASNGASGSSNGVAKHVNGHANGSAGPALAVGADSEYADFGNMASLGKLRKMLSLLPAAACDDRRLWLRIGMAVHAATGGSDAGFAIWDEWSKRSPKYGETWDKWYEDFKSQGNAQGKVDIGTVVYEVREAAEELETTVADTLDDEGELVGGIEAWPPLEVLANAEGWQLQPPAQAVLFDGLMPHGELTALAGAGSEGKSWLTLQMACSIATGMPLCGQWAPNMQGNVLLLNAEDNSNHYWRRVHALATEQIWSEEEWALFKAYVHIACVAGIEKSMTKISKGVITATQLAKRLKRAVEERDYKLVVIDPAIYFRAGDENDSQVQGAFMDALSPSTCNGKCTVMIVQHVPKGTRQREELTIEDLRGSTAMGGAVRWAAVMRTMNLQELRMYPVGEEERRRYVQMSVVKSNYGPVDGAWLHRAPGSGVLTHQVLQAAAGTTDIGMGGGGSRGPAPSASDEQAFAVLEELGGCTSRELGERLGVSHVTAFKMIKRLQANGRVDKDGKPIDSDKIDGEELL